MSSQYTFRLLKEDTEVKQFLDAQPDRERSYHIRAALRQYVSGRTVKGSEPIIEPNPQTQPQIVRDETLETKLNTMF